MKSSKMTIPKMFEKKLTRWFHLADDECEEQSIKRAESQTVGWYSQILFLSKLHLLTGLDSLWSRLSMV